MDRYCDKAACSAEADLRRCDSWHALPGLTAQHACTFAEEALRDEALITEYRAHAACQNSRQNMRPLAAKKAECQHLPAGNVCQVALQPLQLQLGDERDRNAMRAKAPSAPHSVHISSRISGQVQIAH